MKGQPEMDRIVKNSDIERYIDEYIHSERDRSILKRRMIDGITFEKIAEEFEMSPRRIKAIIYKKQDKILLIMDRDGALSL